MSAESRKTFSGMRTSPENNVGCEEYKPKRTENRKEKHKKKLKIKKI